MRTTAAKVWLGELESLKKKLLLLLILALAIPAAAGNRKVASDLPQSGNDPVDVIIQFTTPPKQKHYDKVSQHGGTVKHDLSVVNGLHASMTPAQLNELAADPEVTHISPDRSLTGHLNNGAPAVNAPYAWSLGLDGSNIAVAVIDSGIGDKKTAGFKKSDLNKWHTGSSRVVYSQSWVNDGNGSLDTYGHGTHVAGILAGNGYNSTGSQYTKTFKGIAPNVNL